MSSTVHHLPNENLILHIISSMIPNGVKFMFFKDNEPYDAVPCEEDYIWECNEPKTRTQLVRDLRSD